ncbi:DUF5828 family protein [Halorubrum sp. Ib24]|uniref:DUF5828 family protein n=1 Tax=Halorubrum sp. Ib24 TaxID=1383850 RepID=UPI00374376BE
MSASRCAGLGRRVEARRAKSHWRFANGRRRDAFYGSDDWAPEVHDSSTRTCRAKDAEQASVASAEGRTGRPGRAGEDLQTAGAEKLTDLTRRSRRTTRRARWRAGAKSIATSPRSDSASRKATPEGGGHGVPEMNGQHDGHRTTSKTSSSAPTPESARGGGRRDVRVSDVNVNDDELKAECEARSSTSTSPRSIRWQRR